MSLTKINRLFARPGNAQIYLAAAPTTDLLVSPTGNAAADNASRAPLLYGLFYTDGAARKTLKPGVDLYANVDASGLNMKADAKEIMVDPNLSSKNVIGYEPGDASLEFSFYDADAAHFSDLLSARSEDIVATAAATGIAGRSTLFGGAQVLPRKVIAMLRLPSVLVPGEFDHRLLLRCAFTISIDEKFAKDGKGVMVKTKLVAESDVFALDSNNVGHVYAIDNALVPAL